MLIEIEPPMPAAGPFHSIYRHTLYRNMLAAVEDLGAAWHNVIDDNVDVGDTADRHIAAARLLRMLCSPHRRTYGHALPVTVLPCSVAVLHTASTSAGTTATTCCSSPAGPSPISGWPPVARSRRSRRSSSSDPSAGPTPPSS